MNFCRCAGGEKVSWQVTGVRQDAYAKAHPMQVEEDKTSREKGKYLNPKDLGKSETLGIDYETRHSMMQQLHNPTSMKAPVLPKAPALPPTAFKPIRVPANLSLPNTPAVKP